MNVTILGRRVVITLAAIGAVGALGACNELLKVDNPGAIPEDQISDPVLAPMLVSSVVGEFQRMYTDLAYYSAVISDEAVTGHNFETIKEIDLRIARANNGTIRDDIYRPLQRARYAGDSLSGRLRVIYADSASRSLGLARALAYGGYSTTLLGEFMCKSPAEPLGASLDWDALMARALTRFDESIAIVTAARAAGLSKSDSARADSIINLARVGAARAALNLGDMPKAIGYATPVATNAPAFMFVVPHSTEKSYMEDPFYSATTGNNQNLGVDSVFRNLGDARVKHTAKSRTGHNGLTQLFRPYQSPSFGEWVASDTTQFTRTTPVRFASGLEARYILAEAEGATQRTVDLINERRAVGTPAAIPLTLAAGADTIMAELRTQRSRDFFLDGHRLGDLRRYKKLYSIDLFPQGQHQNASWGTYGQNECFLLPTDETIGNPNASVIR